MADNLSDFAENALVAHSVGKAAYTAPTVYLALYTAAPSDAGGGTEVSSTGTAYARVQVPAASWAAASGGAISTSADILFAVATGAGFGTVTHIGLHDAATAGNLIWYGPLTVSKTVAAGDQFKMPAGQLTLSLA